MARATPTPSDASAAAGGPAGVSWTMAALATLHCLTGCAIGEVLGMVIGTVARLSNAPTVVLSVALAFVFGYALTMRGVLRAGVGLRAALRAALAADTASIAVMELADNAVILAVPGAMDAGLDTALFWASLAFSLLVAFLVTVPLNRWLISRGKGHAVLHAHHGPHGASGQFTDRALLEVHVREDHRRPRPQDPSGTAPHRLIDEFALETRFGRWEILLGRRYRRTRRAAASRGGCPPTADDQGKGELPTPLHFQHIAHRGACGKTRVVPHNR